jgi:hypothetical protein
MSSETRDVTPGPSERIVVSAKGVELEVPASWALLPPGDAGLTRRVKAAGPTWTVKVKRGRRTFSQGLWAPSQNISEETARLETERASPAYQRKLEADRQRRRRAEMAYRLEFRREVLEFLNFDARHEDLAAELADAITEHATPVGSGTVARTQRISVDRRAEAAVIAWLRHQTTAYDRMKIARVKGKRREVRRALAERSRQLLQGYRQGEDPGSICPLRRALAACAEAESGSP